AISAAVSRSSSIQRTFVGGAFLGVCVIGLLVMAVKAGGNVRQFLAILGFVSLSMNKDAIIVTWETQGLAPGAKHPGERPRAETSRKETRGRQTPAGDIAATRSAASNGRPMRQPRSIRFHLSVVFIFFFLLIFFFGMLSIARLRDFNNVS